MEVLTDSNFIEYCKKQYENIENTSEEEFLEDIQRIKYIKKLVTRYLSGEELKERLILNHLIILNNVFGPEATSRIVFLKMEPILPQLKPFLVLLNILPMTILNIRAEGAINTDLIVMDQVVINKLRKI